MHLTGPAGTSAEFQYDENNNIVRADSLTIPGSSDPNVWAEYGYCTATTSAGRWFVHQKQQTDTTGQITYYHYDYNNVGTHDLRGPHG